VGVKRIAILFVGVLVVLALALAGMASFPWGGG